MSDSYRFISWDTDDAALKKYSVATRASGEIVVTIEVRVTDPFRLGTMIEALAEIKKQDEAAAARKDSPRRRSRQRQPGDLARAVAAPPPAADLSGE